MMEAMKTGPNTATESCHSSEEDVCSGLLRLPEEKRQKVKHSSEKLHYPGLYSQHPTLITLSDLTGYLTNVAKTAFTHCSSIFFFFYMFENVTVDSLIT